MGCNCGSSSWKPSSSAGSRARVWTVVQGSTVRRALSQSEAVTLRGQMLASDSTDPVTIYAPGTYGGAA